VFHRRAADVRRQHGILRLEQARVLRLAFVHVEARAGDAAALERRDERGLVHDRPARRVDQIRGGFHGG
jgi:hypothetical protein